MVDPFDHRGGGTSPHPLTLSMRCQVSTLAHEEGIKSDPKTRMIGPTFARYVRSEPQLF